MQVDIHFYIGIEQWELKDNLTENPRRVNDGRFLVVYNLHFNYNFLKCTFMLLVGFQVQPLLQELVQQSCYIAFSTPERDPDILQPFQFLYSPFFYRMEQKSQ